MDLTALLIVTSCSWASPGADRYTGDVVAAVDHYDLPLATKQALKRRIAKHEYTELVKVTRDSIDGYEPELTDMHFGARKLCRTVDRSSWRPAAVEHAMVFCEGDSCLLLPAACGNLSRVKRLRTLATPLAESAGGGGGSAYLPLVLPQIVPPAQVAFAPQPTLSLLPETPWAPVPYSPLPVIVWVSGYYCPPHQPMPSPVPEPATWALLLAGLGALAWKGYHRGGK